MKLSIVLPVKNEGVNIPVILRLLEAVVEVPHEILIVYDEPGDETLPVVEAHHDRYPMVKLVHNALGPGVTSAIVSGARAACGEYVLICAVDDTGPVLAIMDMVALMDRGCDLVSCTRYAHGGRRLGGSIIGRVLSRAANYLFCHVAGGALSDATTGIKMVRRSMLLQLTLEARRGWAVAFELAIKAQLTGLRLGEVPIISVDRLFGGQSSFLLGPWIGEYLKWFLWGAKQLRHHKPHARVMTMPSVRQPVSSRDAVF